jgi:hypothetical protein
MKLKDKKNETLEPHIGPVQPHEEDTSVNHTPSYEEIRLRACEIYLERSALPGNELNDWLQAERKLQPAAPTQINEFSTKRATQRNVLTSSKLLPFPCSRLAQHLTVLTRKLWPAIDSRSRSRKRNLKALSGPTKHGWFSQLPCRWRPCRHLGGVFHTER